jgi:hypothetical protein
MMHGKSVSHVDVSIRFHHVIHQCSWRATVCSFSGADECASEGLWVSEALLKLSSYKLMMYVVSTSYFKSLNATYIH